MRVWAWIAIGLAVFALAFLVFPLVQIQTKLRLANEQVVQANAGMAELERIVANLKQNSMHPIEHEHNFKATWMRPTPKSRRSSLR